MSIISTPTHPGTSSFSMPPYALESFNTDPGIVLVSSPPLKFYQSLLNISHIYLYLSCLNLDPWSFSQTLNSFFSFLLSVSLSYIFFCHIMPRLTSSIFSLFMPIRCLTSSIIQFLWPNHPISSYLIKINESICPQQDLNKNVYSRSIEPKYLSIKKTDGTMCIAIKLTTT